MRHREFYPNGYGVSIISNEWSYGLELAVLEGNENDWEICYHTPITNDVVGHCSPQDLVDIIEQVKALPPLPPRYVEGVTLNGKPITTAYKGDDDEE